MVCSVAHGSFLGPLEFLAYTKDLGDIKRHDIYLHLFADDTQIYHSVHPHPGGQGTNQKLYLAKY